MKKILRITALLLTLLLLCACSSEEDDAGDSEESLQETAMMRATVTGISDKIEVNVIEGEYGASGPYWVVTSDDTRFESEDGESISRDDLSVGDTVEIRYGGQVMMSYPPQIVAVKITVVG